MEDIVRSFASASGGGVGLVSAFAGSAIKPGRSESPFPRCIDLGAKVMSSREEDTHEDYPEGASGGLCLSGKVEKVEAEPEQGLSFQDLISWRAREISKAPSLRIWFKNENHIAWLGGKVVATSPDTISIFDPQKRQGIWNWDEVPRDKELVVFGFPAKQVLEIKEGPKSSRAPGSLVSM